MGRNEPRSEHPRKMRTIRQRWDCYAGLVSDTLLCMKRTSRDEWLRDIDERQRNIVFPDTAANEARFWRSIIFGKSRLTTAQTIGITLMWLAVAFPLGAFLKWMTFSIYAWLALMLFAAAFLLLRWRTRKALASIEHVNTKPK